MGDFIHRAGRILLNQTIRLYYRRIEIEHADRIPVRGPGILVANHPNSVMDAFVLCMATRRKINFIAKDSITRAPAFGWLAQQFGVMGVARGMDYGRERELARDRNRAAIAACVPRLLAGELLIIFGEGISTDSRYLHMIRKGAMRFGLAAEQAAGFQLGLAWIPVGITYSSKQRFRSDVLIAVGQPFTLDSLGLDPIASEAKLLQEGTAHLQRSIESLVVNIEREELASLTDRLTDLISSPVGMLAKRIASQQRVARAVQYYNVTQPDRVAALEQGLHNYDARIAAAGLTDEVIRQRHPGLALRSNLAGALKGTPLMALSLYGWANGLVPRWVAHAARQFGAQPLNAQSPKGNVGETRHTKEALTGTVAGWIAAAIAFPIQIYLVHGWLKAKWGAYLALPFDLLYGLSLIPSWQFYVRRRDTFRKQLANVLTACKFLLHGGRATRLHGMRKRLQRRTRTLLAEYESGAK